MHVNVSVAVLINDEHQVLLAERPFPKAWEGWWEFPGGKVEPGESVLNALKRELIEELGIKVVSASPWCGIDHHYPHARVRLNFYIVQELNSSLMLNN